MAADGWAIAVMFLLISQALPGIESNKIAVSQMPASIHVFEGDNVNLNCFFKPGGITSYTWHKDSCLVDLKAERYKKRVVLPDDERFKTKGDASIQIKNISLVDSGVYRCDIDSMGKGNTAGPGTLVLVHENCAKANNPTSPLPDWMWIAVTGGVAFLIILLLLAAIGVLARRNKAYALLVRECSSFDSAKEPIAAPRIRTMDHPNHQREDAYLHSHCREGAPRKKRPPQAARNLR
ncbi:uncharacterized protein LOC144602685 [Rhinoraja longicauda]